MIECAHADSHASYVCNLLPAWNHSIFTFGFVIIIHFLEEIFD